jgi:hypothetical protein
MTRKFHFEEHDMKEKNLHGLSTRQLAQFMDVAPESIRVQLCRAGHYHGLRPDRLPNGRLLWPADSRERLLDAGRRMTLWNPPGSKARRRKRDKQ